MNQKDIFMRRKSLFFTMLSIFALLVATEVPQVQAEKKKEPNQILITNVDVWDGESDAVKKRFDVLVEGNLVKSIGKINAPRAIVIDGGGRTLIPGLIEMHTHLMFRYGVTVMRNDFDAQATGAAAMESLQLYLQMG
jgi:imidazolonepropionase-like amidohydrolase